MAPVMTAPMPNGILQASPDAAVPGTLMFFQTVSRTENIVLLTASVACIVLGIAAIVRSGRD